MRSKITEMVVVFAILVAAVAMWFVADKFPNSMKYARIDSDFWPKLVCGALAVVSFLQLLQQAVGLRASLQSASAGTRSSVDPAYVARLVLIGGLILAYFFALQWLGFVIATLLFLWAASFATPYSNLTAKLLFSPLFTFGLCLFFTRGLSLPLPRGQGIFYDLSLLLY
ncbi:tripartite tricarboxylate transporter TctB family protein [Stappia sp. BW2]|uniref:tripartite tricarboxylate transporter TctB family protein n=1 Tax=Stappia sp. BW2 TaxID=2592622 RepID=UPI0011DEC32D|nr:tripartite tricarboxylate transporter TctB family protein [Stappia sp. BW2]TYC67798.1 tripartite tricarboxylate transporter TctB family protein [Stappia sp. BW2]